MDSVHGNGADFLASWCFLAQGRRVFGCLIVQGNRYSSDCHAVSDSKTCHAAIGVSFPQIKMIESSAMGFGKVH